MFTTLSALGLTINKRIIDLNRAKHNRQALFERKAPKRSPKNPAARLVGGLLFFIESIIKEEI